MYKDDNTLKGKITYKNNELSQLINIPESIISKCSKSLEKKGYLTNASGLVKNFQLRELNKLFILNFKDQDTKIEQNVNDISLLKKEIEKLKEENREMLKILQMKAIYQIYNLLLSIDTKCNIKYRSYQFWELTNFNTLLIMSKSKNIDQFFTLPNNMTTENKLSPSDVLIYIYLKSYDNPEHQCYPSLKKLSEASINTIRTCIGNLEKCGYIKIKKIGKETTITLIPQKGLNLLVRSF